ncbi:hypothetical protein [Nonomuraea sp. NPDC049758]|uniref:hypothetical protein n=1 Tax=Nonomuraea sp. NPDC049758 TaxID=3154360 RepID=UPI003443C9AD
MPTENQEVEQGMVGTNRTPSEEDDAIAEFFGRFFGYVQEAARRSEHANRRQAHREGGGKPLDIDLAKALELSASTIGHWRKERHFPRQTLISSVLVRAGLEVRHPEHAAFLDLARRAHHAWTMREAATGGSVKTVLAESRVSDTVDVPIRSTGGRGIFAPMAAGGNETADTARDMKKKSEPGPPEERCPEMAASPPDLAQERCRPGPDDVALSRIAPEGEDRVRLARAANALARRLRVQWEDEAADRGLDNPPPIPPRWVRTSRPVASRLRVALDDPQRPRFMPLSGVQQATAQAVEGGGLAGLFDLYAGLGSGRIVVMGHHGTGKSATAILLLLEALDHRVRLTLQQAMSTPVPVLLNACDWDPRRHGLSDWFARQLATAYDFLTSPEYGPDAAGELVRHGMVSLLLDGFDEMDQPRQIEALHHINRQRRSFRLLLLARTDDFSTAVQARTSPLHGAAAVELLPVAGEQAIRYLQDHQPDRLADDDSMSRLIDRLRQHPDDPVSQALDTPLTLTLLREDPHAAADLLRPGRFSTREQAEDFLLDRVVPATYPPHRSGPSAEQARRWLGFLATRMGRGDLAWWQMHHWAPMWERCLINALAGMLLMSGIGALVFGPIGRYTVAGDTGTAFGVWYGALMGGGFGLLAGLVSELRDPRSGWADKLSAAFGGRPARLPRRWPRPAFNTAAGLAIFVVVTMAVGNQSTYPYGLAAGIVAAAVAGHAATRIRSTSGTGSWWSRLRPGGVDLLAAAAIGGPIGLAYGLSKTPPHGTFAGLIAAFGFGLMVSVARPIADIDTPPTPLMRWRLDRRRALLVACSAAIPISMALGFQNGRAHGLPAGIVTAAGFGIMITLGSIAAISDVWRTGLLFAQLRMRRLFPLRGMRFLEDAHRRHVLRTAGARYQFKHDRLRATLANGCRRSDPPR